MENAFVCSTTEENLKIRITNQFAPEPGSQLGALVSFSANNSGNRKTLAVFHVDDASFTRIGARYVCKFDQHSDFRKRKIVSELAIADLHKAIIEVNYVNDHPHKLSEDLLGKLTFIAKDGTVLSRGIVGRRVGVN